MDILAALASDPTALPLWAVLAFAASMYPVGMLFGCQSCCQVCQSCCRDEVGQVVIDFALEGTGEQLAKATPWGGIHAFSFESVPMRVDPLDENPGWQNWANAYPMFFLEGQESGARVLMPALANDDGTYSPWLNPIHGLAIGNTDDTEFVDGESVSVTPRPALENVVESNLTAVVSPCPKPSVFYSDTVAASFVGTRGKWQAADPQPDLYFDCQSDEGTVIFDVQDHDDRQPEFCDDCTPSVKRFAAHPGSFLLNPCWTSGNNSELGSFNRYFLTAERSGLSVAVNLMRYGPRSADNCPEEITASAVAYWIGIGNQYCTKTTDYTLAADEQDCSPFSAWPTETEIEGPGAFEEQLVTLSATSNFGSGFFGVATDPAGVPGVDDGPLTAATVVDPGSAYAEIGRKEPTVTLSHGTGSGADLAITWTETEDEQSRPVWQIASVAVGSGGGGADYTHGSTLTVDFDVPVYEVEPAYLEVRCVREEPTLAINAYNGGSGLTVTFALSAEAGPPPYWALDSMTITDGGTGYTYGDLFDVAGATGDDLVEGFTFGTLTTTITEPTLSLIGGSGYQAGTGTTAELSITLASLGGSPETWEIDSVAIDYAGSSYQVDDVFTVVKASGDVEVYQATVRVTSVDGSGAITGVAIDGGGAYYHETGVVESLDLTFNNGQFYRVTGEIDSVEVYGGGRYYETDATLPALVADITIDISQKSPSDGAGASILAVVDDDPTSETFGQITGLTFANGGDGYLAVHDEPGICAGPGGVYRANYAACGGFAAEDMTGRGFLFKRACPDYTYDITIQPAGS
jgi:hypothetical protein